MSLFAPLAYKLPLASLVLMTALTAGCSNSGEDVRVTLCRDLVRVQLGNTPTWSGQRIEPHGRAGAVVSLNWTGTAGSDGQATCHYPYNAADSDLFATADPMAAYSTSPTQFVLNGRSIRNPELARLIGLAMRQQGQELIDRARAGL